MFLDREVMGLGIFMCREVLDQEGGKWCRMWCCENFSSWWLQNRWKNRVVF